MRTVVTDTLTLASQPVVLQTVLFQPGDAGVRITLQRVSGQWDKDTQACSISMEVRFRHGQVQQHQSGIRRGVGRDRTGQPQVQSVWEVMFYANDGQGHSIPDPQLETATITLHTHEGQGFRMPVIVEVL